MTTASSHNPPVPPLSVVGVSHRTLAVSDREQFGRLEPTPDELLKRIAEECELTECAVLSTCNRFEVISVGDEGEERVARFLTQRVPRMDANKSLYRYREREALRHVFRVTSSLDSMVLGEGEIVGQVKAAYQLSQSCGLSKKYLHHLFQFALHIAKKVRSTTSVAERGVSVSFIAVKLAQQIFGSLDDHAVLLIGSGNIAELAALHLKSQGCSKIAIANRTLANAERLASQIGGSAISLDEIREHLPKVDIVIGSAITDRPLIEIQSLRHKRARPLFLIDLGVPRNFPSDLNDVDDVYLYNIDDLGTIADENRNVREEAARDAEVIIEFGVFQFERWLERVTREPLILDMRSRIARICESELRREIERIVPDAAQDEIMQKISHRISQRISHELTELIGAPLPEEISDNLLSAMVAERALKLS